ncbi:hypothetical protein [Streptomyces catenulae]|uniref:Elongation factor Tu n=1 Tax=Streptomyces catenulae TaxID=66875 RepID=A0ABV2Z728_9ACTN|nr:hypothetical protein [Streptomyces catenulae]
MGIFSRRGGAEPPPVTGPFRFTVTNVFVVPVRGVVFTGQVVSGAIRTGQRARLPLPTGPREATVAAIEVRRRKRGHAAEGEEAALYLDGVTAADLPRDLAAGGAVLDPGPLRGLEITGG